ncbi:MAG: hypothetical protein IKJ09_09605 [Bacteroidaceae bacterium]|nr:hypothetical protein [Bacteroidaceae bacterium]
MIDIKIPTSPQKSDFIVNNCDIKRAEEINEKISADKRRYEKNNSSISFVLAFVIFSIISGLVIGKYNPELNDTSHIILSSILGLLFMFPFGGMLSILLQNIGHEIEPNRAPKNDSRYTRANEYAQALEKYNKEIASIKACYPGIEDCEFDCQKYNDFLISYFKNLLDRMILNKRVETLRRIIYNEEKYFDNLDLIACKNIQRINYNLYNAERMQKSVLITYMKRLERDKLDEFIIELKKKNNIKGIIITEEHWHKDTWYFNFIEKNEIELVHINAFEKIVTREIEKSGFTIHPNDNSTPFNSIDIQYTDIGGYKLYSRERNYIGFSFQLVTEVFNSKKEIYEKIKNIPRQKGIYGIIKYMNKPIYGLVFFREGGEIHYFMRCFCAAIDNETKEISNIVNDHRRMRTDCGPYWYSGWSTLCYED